MKTKQSVFHIEREREGVSEEGEMGRDGERMEKGKGDREAERRLRKKEPAV